MSFYTALTGLKGAQTDISTTSNNIANVGSSGFKKSRAEFGDIFSQTPLQTNGVGTGTLTKSVKQQFSQGNISQSTNTLDMAISGQGFFALQGGGNAGQTVYTRNGAFSVNEDGFIVDSNGQFLLGYPVDTAGAVSDKTLDGATKMQLAANFGEPQATENILMGVNLPSDAEVIGADVEFDANDATTYSASSSITIFDNGGNPKSATVFYIKTQDPTATDQTFKYDTKMFVDGAEITPELTRSTDTKGNALLIDKFGQTTTSAEDPGYILEGKGSPLYKADDLGEPEKSTPAMLTGEGLETYLGEGRTIEIVTDPMQFKRTMEYQTLTDVASPVPGTFWGKDFLLVDVDGSGPVSIDVPPGVYDGEELAAAVQIALREAFGDDKQIQLTDGVDSTFTVDLKLSSGDGTSTGLVTPMEIDLHEDTLVSESIEAGYDPADGLSMNAFLTHAQIQITEELNAYIQDGVDVDATAAAEMGVEGRLFKNAVGSQITDAPQNFDIISFDHLNEDIDAAAQERYIAYANVDDNPDIKAYDKTYAPALTAFTADGDGYLVVTITGDQTALDHEVFRFQQNTVDGETQEFIGQVGASEISIKSMTLNGAGNTEFVLNHTVTGTAIIDGGNGTESAINILAKPSDYVEAYFEDTDGLVEGVSDVFYSNKIVLREIDSAAKRTSDAAFASNAGSFSNFARTNTDNEIADFGLDAIEETMAWVDQRDPAIKLGYDETNQRITFEGDNGQLGKGTGVGFDAFTVYSIELDSGDNGLGIPALGDSPQISLETDDLLLGEAFLADGPEVRVANKRYGMEVEFDTVANVFNISSGTTGEAIAANSVVGINAAQSASTVAVGRYNLTETGGVDQTDTAEYDLYKVGNGLNQIMGFPREGVEGYTEPSGLVSNPATTAGYEALLDMSEAFTITELAGENIFNVVVNGISASITIPEGNYKGDTLATALESRINAMKNPISGRSVGGVTVEYDSDLNNLSFTTATTGEGSTIAVNGALKFGLNDIPLGIGTTTVVRTPVQATDELGRPLYIAPNGEITPNSQAFADNMVEDFFPLYLDEGELTFDLDGQLVSPITNVTYSSNLTQLTLDFTNATQFDQVFSASALEQDGYSAGRLTNLEIDNYGNVRAGYSNGQNLSLGKIMLASFVNESGLKQIGNSTFIATDGSGDPELGEASEDGFGQILSGSLERSNVDITEELVNLITSQRNYQAAAKAIETSTSMTQTIINIRS
ncbi:MAG: flagellar hook-basal body complex protein [Paracoccaceae bacterium]